ncbi:Bacterial regulatory proteins, tetR family [Clostridiales bacterium CHKCI006]|nr:Bacterial regulatory proteins, tetR family [Clostridiales bacterium CHKCI006]
MLHGLVIKAHTTNVKVSDICKQAQISRKTFYYYFKDKHDIIEYIFCEEIEQTMTMG